MCPPAGARVGSGTVGWTASTYGRSVCRPDAGAASPAMVSSSVPARWMVPARRTSGLVHGTGSDSTQSTLKTPGPCLYRDTHRR
jgi:hypothetical protein